MFGFPSAGKWPGGNGFRFHRLSLRSCRLPFRLLCLLLRWLVRSPPLQEGTDRFPCLRNDQIQLVIGADGGPIPVAVAELRILQDLAHVVLHDEETCGRIRGTSSVAKKEVELTRHSFEVVQFDTLPFRLRKPNLGTSRTVGLPACTLATAPHDHLPVATPQENVLDDPSRPHGALPQLGVGKFREFFVFRVRKTKAVFQTRIVENRKNPFRTAFLDFLRRTRPFAFAQEEFVMHGFQHRKPVFLGDVWFPGLKHLIYSICSTVPVLPFSN